MNASSTRSRRALAFLALLGVCACGTKDKSAPPPGAPPADPLHRAAWAGQVDELRALVQGGAALDAVDDAGLAPLHWAAVAGQSAAAQLLLSSGADPNARARFDLTPLHWAALAGRAELVPLLVHRGARVDARNLYGMTPLHEAADAKVVAALLAAGAPRDVPDDWGRTPLHVARSEAVALALLERGADIRARTRDGRTAMELAVFDGMAAHGLYFYATRTAARLRGATGRLEIGVRNIATAARVDLELSVASPACEGTVTPASLPRLAPGQMTRLTVELARRDGVADGKHPLVVTARAGAAELGRFELTVDTTPGVTPEDRGAIRLGRAAIRPRGSRAGLLLYVAVPLLVGVAALGAWATRRRARRGSRPGAPARG